MKRILYYDCFAGISGDMNLGALVDLGVDPGFLKEELGRLGVEGFRLEVERDKRKGISGTRVTVVIDHPDNEKHRHLHHITDLISGSALPDKVKSTSLAIFDRVAVAEAEVHSIPKEKVHFHEVGALDSIADIVGAAICLEALDVDEVLSSPVQLGGGTVQCAHGLMPVPAPATAEIVKGIPVRTGLVDYEATTPTGAAILAETVDRFVTECELNILRTGYGIGQRDGSIPNVLRVYLAESGEQVLQAAQSVEDLKSEDAVMLECNMDDMNPEWYTHVTSLLFEAGASEVFVTPVVMKKSRPGHLLSVLCPVESTDRLREILFTGTSSIGLREQRVKKHILRREMAEVTTVFGSFQVKRSYFKGKMIHEKPEFEQCRKAAAEHGVSLEQVYREIEKNLQ